MSKEIATRAISKVLSANDAGETGAHQAGILVPSDPDVLSFFPKLGKTEKNPRVHLVFVDDSNEEWEFAFIYYNNRFFGGTRNEYRLTRMTPYINSNNLKAGDELILYVDNNGVRHVTFKRAELAKIEDDGVLRLGSSWKVISL